MLAHTRPLSCRLDARILQAALGVLSIAIVHAGVRADDGSDQRRLEANHPATSPERMEQLAKDPAWEVRQAVGRSRRASTEVLHALADDPHEQVRIAVAINLKTATKTYMKLARDKVIAVRSVMARCGYMPAEVLDLLSRDASPDIRIEVAANEGTSGATLERLTRDPDGGVAAVAATVLAQRQDDGA